MILVRPRAWWFNKVPLSVTLVLLLLDGRPFSAGALAVLVSVVLTVCAVGNYGYALNELFDVAEDARLGRSNAAASAGPRRMWAIIALSAACAPAFATAASSLAGAILTALALCLPLAYSVPPLRVKERKWLGVCADGLAAHVFPALLALLAVSHWALRPIPTVLAACVALWAVAAGLRGILSHQLHTAEQDRGAGLITVVHDFGNARVERFVIAVLLPLEVGGFAGALIACGTGPVLWLVAVAYLAYEAYKTAHGGFRVSAFRAEGQRYVPFVEESFYKTWGPLAFALDAARTDLVYVAAIPLYALLFRPLLRIEGHRLRSVWAALRVSRARNSAARSGGES